MIDLKEMQMPHFSQFVGHKQSTPMSKYNQLIAF